MQPITISLRPLYSHVEALNIIIMNECHIFHLSITPIRNLPTLVVLTPPRLPCTPSIDYTHLFVYYDNTSIDYIDFSTDCANKYDDSVNTHDDWVNTIID
jgi:hypothetical protein